MGDNATQAAAGGSGTSLSEALPDATTAALETSELVGVVIDKLEGWLTTFVAMLPNLVVALLVLLFAGLVSRLLSRLIERGTRRATHNDQVAGLVATTVRLGTVAVGVFVALGLLNLDKTVTSLLAGVGVVGLALGFAFQDIASNFMSGIIMAIRQPFELGDLVTTHDTMGRVERVTLRATVLRNFDGQLVIIPNKEVLQNPITNYTRSGERRVAIDVGVSYGDDLEQAREVAVAALEQIDGRDDSKAVDAIYTGFDDSSIGLSLRFWIDPSSEQLPYLEARSQAIIAVKRAFDEAGLTIPFPIRTLDFGLNALAVASGSERTGEFGSRTMNGETGAPGAPGDSEGEAAA